MKKIVLTGLAVMILALTGCQALGDKAEAVPGSDSGEAVASGGSGSMAEGTAGSGSEAEGTAGDGSGGAGKGESIPGSEEGTTVKLRLVEGGGSASLLLAGKNRGEVYSVSLGSNVPVYLDGRLADSSVLEDGMMLEVLFNSVLETYPAQLGGLSQIRAYSLGTEENPSGTYYDLCGLYLQVLNDLWDVDSGLNKDVRYVSVDLSQAPGGLTEAEKDAIAWSFAGQHGVEALTLTQEELAEEGYLTEVDTGAEYKVYQWEEGVLFSITPVEEAPDFNLSELKFDAEKWRGPLGAYCFVDCTAVWPEGGTWSGYEVDMEAVS